MSTNIITIGLGQLAVSLFLIALAGAASLVYKLQLERDLLVGTIRTFAQLFLMGYALQLIFRINEWWIIVLIFAAMIFFAAYTIRGRIKEREIPFFPSTLLAMMLSYMLVSILVTGVIIGAKPWWTPQYFLPIGGMVIGNSMNAIALSLERLLSDLRKRREEVEMMLSLGADYKEASQDILKQAMSAGMIPSINSMMGVGLVFIPGMMTGQILAGVDPLIAIRYQIMVMVMLVGSTAVGSLLITLLVRKLCFGPAHELRLKVRRSG